MAIIKEQMEQADDEQSNVSKQEQDQYDVVTIAALSALYQPGAAKIVAKKLEDEKDRMPFAVGHTAAMTLLSVKRALKERGAVPPKEVMFHAGQEVIAAVIEIGVEAGLIPREGIDKLAQEAAFEAIRVYGSTELQTGELTPEDRAEAQKEYEGMLDGQMPGDGGAADQQQAPVAQPQPQEVA